MILEGKVQGPTVYKTIDSIVSIFEKEAKAYSLWKNFSFTSCKTDLKQALTAWWFLKRYYFIFHLSLFNFQYDIVYMFYLIRLPFPKQQG